MNDTNLLRELQLLDASIDKTQDRLREIEIELGDDSEVTEATTIHKAISEKLEELSISRRRLERDVADLTQQLNAVNKRIYGGTIQNERELSALQDEMDALSKKTEENEDILLETMIQHERYESGLLKANENLNAIKQSRKTNLKSLTVEKAAGSKFLSERIPSRDSTRALCDSKSLISYDRLIKSRGGLAIATMVSDLCSACRVAVPSQLIQELRSGDSFVFCNSCQRILCLSD